MTAADQERPSQYKVSLAKELIDDIETSRLAPRSLLLKAMRLARITTNDRMLAFLHYELYGYPDKLDALEFGTTVGRMTNPQLKWGYWDPLPAIHSQVEAAQLQLQQLRIPDVSYAPKSASQFDHVGHSPYLPHPMTQTVNNVIQQQTASTSTIVQLTAIVSRVLASIYDWALKIYHELLLSGHQETIFEIQKTRVDTLLAERCGDILIKIPAVYHRLAEGDQEAISQALSTCRRIMDTVCDAIQPPSYEPVMWDDGKPMGVTSREVRNRFRVYLRQRCQSGSRRDRLNQTLTHLYDRTSTGVHNDVLAEEARYLFLLTYLWVGEALSLPELPPPPALPKQLESVAPTGSMK